jgi:hypothetical protein
MATNSLNGLNLTVIAAEALPVLKAKLAPIALFTTDFSEEVAMKGSAISTRIASVMTAQDYDKSTGYNPQNATSSAVTVTLNKHKHYTVGFDDAEVGNASLPVLQNTFIAPAINAICAAVQSDLLALMTTAFPAVYSASYASFGFAGVTTAAKVLDNSGSNAPRAALLGTNLYYDVLDDIKGLYTVGADALRAGNVGMLGNVATALVPTSTFAGTGLAGFVGGKDALCIAARLPGVPSGNIEVANVTDPDSGFTVQLRKWYSPDEGQWKLSAVAIYGVIRGNTSSGVRVITTD